MGAGSKKLIFPYSLGLALPTPNTLLADLEYTDCTPCKEIRPHLKCILGMTLACIWSSVKCGVPLHCHYFQVHSAMVPFLGQINLFKNHLYLIGLYAKNLKLHKKM